MARGRVTNKPPKPEQTEQKPKAKLPTRYQQIAGDIAYWEEICPATGWKLFGFTMRRHASYISPSDQAVVGLTAAQRDDIMRAIKGGAEIVLDPDLDPNA